MLKKESYINLTDFGFLFLFAVTIGILGYTVARTDFILYISLYTAAFSTYGLIIFNAFQHKNLKLWQLLAAALFVRLALLGMQPNLSDDFFRFAWDGRLLAAGINPFLYSPEELLDSQVYKDLQLDKLFYGDPINDWSYYNGLNSKPYHSVYPTALQLVFGFSALLFPHHLLGQLIVMRLFIILAELGTFYFTVKILKIRKLDERLLLIYAFNPLIILEWTGNIHFEVFAVFFLSGAVYYLLKNKITVSALFLSGAVVSKLIPLLFLPLFFAFTGWKKGSLHSFLTLIFSALLLLPFFADGAAIANLGKSLNLYFASFELNASFYYLIQYLWGFFAEYSDKNLIVKLLQFSLILFILWMAFRKKQLIAADFQNYLFFALLAYFLATRTVHPWYLGTLVWLCIFTPYRLTVFWSFLVGLTYITYWGGGFEERIWVVVLEYWVLLGIAVYELRSAKQSPAATID